MLRYYDEAGLFKPAFIDDFTAYRYYSAAQLKTINKIVSLRDMGFSVAEIAQLLKTTSVDIQKEILLAKQEEIKTRIKTDEHSLALIRQTQDYLTKENSNMDYNVEIKEIPAYQVISYRGSVPTYADEGMLWHKLGEFCQEKRLKCLEKCFAIYHDPEYKESDVDIEIVIEVADLANDDGDFVYKTTAPISECACLYVPGDYSNIAPAFTFLGEWIEKNDYRICGNCRQVSIRGPWNETDTDNYLVEIQIPVCR